MAAGKTVRFALGTPTADVLFDFDGLSGDHIVLDTSTGSGVWTLSDAGETNDITYCEIRRSTATGGATFEAFIRKGNVNGGNSGWDFGPTKVGPFPTFLG